MTDGSSGHAQLVEYAPFKRDSHGMLASRDGEKVWLAETMGFLKSVGMPTEGIGLQTQYTAIGHEAERFTVGRGRRVGPAEREHGQVRCGHTAEATARSD